MTGFEKDERILRLESALKDKCTTTERLAKIEVLEEVKREMFNENNDYVDVLSYIDCMIAELKEANR